LYLNEYNYVMNYMVEQTDTFAQWHAALRDLRAKIAIARRIDRAANGNMGDAKSVIGDVSEMRVDGVRVIAFILPCAAVRSLYC
jgi:putative addiction module killer protein